MYTEADVRKKMDELGIKGYGAMGTFTPDELMGQLEAIASDIKQREAAPPAAPAPPRRNLAVALANPDD